MNELYFTKTEVIYDTNQYSQIKKKNEDFDLAYRMCRSTPPKYG